MPEPTVVCVLGMHRSGTSLVARALNLLGVYLGPDEHMMAPNANNPRGFWEHQGIKDLNDEILVRLGGSWADPPALAEGWEGAPELSDLRQRARAILQEDFLGKKLWGWKDPRTCLTLPFWRQVCPPMRYVLCLRNPVDVAASLRQAPEREGLELERPTALWLRSTTNSLQHSYGHPRLFVFYEDLITDSREPLTRLAAFIGRRKLMDNAKVAGALENAVSEDLWHHRTSVEDAIDNSELDFPAKAAYLSLRLQVSLAEKRKGAERGQVSGRVLENFTRSALVVSDAEDSLKRTLDEQRALVAGGEEATRALAADLAAREEDLRALRERLDERERQALRDITELHRKVEEQAGHAGRAEREIAELQRAIEEQAERERQAERDLAELHRTVEEQTGRARRAERDLAELHRSLEKQAVRPADSEARPSSPESLHGDGEHAGSRASESSARANHSLPYPELVRRIQQSVPATLPPEATVAVVSRGDDALLALACRRAWHFPQEEHGLYAGHHPADSASAIAHLEEIRSKGADFLLLPATGLWWLDHYTGFREHLDGHYRAVMRDSDVCLIYDLRSNDRSRGAVRPRFGSRLRRLRPLSSTDRPASGITGDKFPHDGATDRLTVSSPLPGDASAAFEGASREVVDEIQKSGLFDEHYYLETYPDVRASGVTAAEHFCAAGWKAGKRPNPYFDTQWYLDTSPDVRDSGINPLWHYIVEGEKEGRRPCIFFDPEFYRRTVSQKEGSQLADYLAHVQRGEWRSPVQLFDVDYYLTEYRDVREAGADPVLHYMWTGHAEGRNPSRRFHTSYYRAKYLSGDRDINPLVHYYETGQAIGNETAPGDHDGREDISAEIQHWANQGDAFEEFDPEIALASARRAKLIAFYLPQFHAIPENDEWWGKGFTEWRNIMRGVPRFGGHYQPRIPRDLGFYDLTTPGVMSRQIELARQAGVHGFAFYYYSFDGKRLLERPLERFLGDSSLDFPFCLVWANENWTRRWDGKDAEVLMKQGYRQADDEALVDDFSRYFADPRYIRIEGRPLLVIYRLDIIPNGRHAVERWRELWQARHGERPLIFLAQTFGVLDPREHGLDGAVEFPPHKLTQDGKTINTNLTLLDPKFKGHVFDYEEIAARSLMEPYPDYPLVKTVVPSWDNDARRQGDGLVLHGSTPERYEKWLSGLVEIAEKHPVYGDHLVFANAWNEWAEAAYLEPDVHYGGAYLNATARAVCGIQRRVRKRKVLLVGHDGHPFGAQINVWHMGEALRNDFGCEVAYLLLDGGSMVPRYGSLGKVRVVEGDLERARAFLVQLQDEGYDLAITNTVATGDVVPYLKDAGFQVVSLIHELPGIIDEYDLRAPLEQIGERSDKIVVAAESVAETVTGPWPKAKAKTVIRPQGLYADSDPSDETRARVRREIGIPADGRIVLTVGSGDLRKGLDIFLHAAKLAARQAPNLHFVWVGKLNDDTARWLRMDVRDGLEERVHFVPFTDDVARYFASSDVFFLSSREDPYPSVVLEAMQAGLPVVALQDSGGIEQLVSAHGRVVDRNDLSEIVKVLAESADCRDQGARAKRREIIQEQYRYDDYAFDLLRFLDPALKKVSVVIPNFNYRDYLSDRMHSIFSQTYPIFEVIVLDDCSTDGSLDELTRIRDGSDRRFSVVANEHNSGSAFRQWIKACQLARGDYLWIAEADDLSRPDFLQRLMESIGNADVAFAFSDSAQIDGDGRPLGAGYKDYYRAAAGDLMERDFVTDGKSFVEGCLIERNLVLNVSSVVWNRSCLMDVLDRHIDDLADYHLAGDWYLYGAAALSGKQVGYVAEPLNIHRRHEKSVTSSLDRRRHVEEVRQVHAAIAGWLDADVGIRTRMATYEAELAELFDLTDRERANGGHDFGATEPAPFPASDVFLQKDTNHGRTI